MLCGDMCFLWSFDIISLYISSEIMLSIFKYEVLWHEVIILTIFSQVHVYILHTTLLPDVNTALHTKSNGGSLP